MCACVRVCVHVCVRACVHVRFDLIALCLHSSVQSMQVFTRRPPLFVGTLLRLCMRV